MIIISLLYGIFTYIFLNSDRNSHLFHLLMDYQIHLYLAITSFSNYQQLVSPIPIIVLHLPQKQIP